MEIKTSSLIATDQKFSSLSKANAGSEASSKPLKSSAPQNTAEIVDKVDIQSDILNIKAQTAEIQVKPQPVIESKEVIIEFERASDNIQASSQENPIIRSADTATQAFGNSADITI